MRSREEFLKWYHDKSDDLGDWVPNPHDIYDFFQSPRVEDVYSKDIDPRRFRISRPGIYNLKLGDHSLTVIFDPPTPSGQEVPDVVRQALLTTHRYFGAKDGEYACDVDLCEKPARYWNRKALEWMDGNGWELLSDTPKSHGRGSE